MKKILTLGLIVFPIFLGFGQTKKEKEEVRQHFWGGNNQEDISTEIDEKWKDESAVILYKNINYDYNKRGVNVTYTSSVRKRVYLNDNAAVERFSTLSRRDHFSRLEWLNWGYSVPKMFIGVKILKPDGTETIIDVEKNSVEKEGRKEVAVPNLGVGDILDFYISMESSYIPSGGVKVFTPVERLISEEFPIKYFKLDFGVDNDFYVNFQSHNGAPELEGLVTDTRKDRKYQIIAEDIDKVKLDYWVYPLNYLPCYKMQVSYTKTVGGKALLPVFTADNTKSIKSQVEKEEVVDLFNRYVKPAFAYADLKKEIKTFVKENRFTSIEDKVTALYYYLRYLYQTQEADVNVYEREDILEGVKYQDPLPYIGYVDGSYEFVKRLRGVLDQEKIAYEIVVGQNRLDGPIQDIILTQNARVFMRIPLGNESMYINFFGTTGLANSIDSRLEGTEAYSIDVKKNALSHAKIIQLPTSTYQENKSINTISLSLEDMKDVKIQENVKVFGHQKVNHYNSLIYYVDYIDEDLEKYSGVSFLNRVKGSKAQLARLKERVNGFEDEVAIKRDENVKSYFEEANDVTLADDYTFEILKTGRYSKEEPFEYSMDYKLEDQWIKKAGPNYLFEIGKCIGTQKSIKENERERTIDIDFSFARSYDNEVLFTIPEGYTVKGIEKLNKKVVNETGGFESVATLEGNVLKVTAKKHYATNHVNKEDWSKMVEFLDAAYQFTQEKVLLKKI